MPIKAKRNVVIYERLIQTLKFSFDWLASSSLIVDILFTFCSFASLREIFDLFIVCAF